MSWNQICKSNQKILISANLFHFFFSFFSRTCCHLKRGALHDFTASISNHKHIQFICHYSSISRTETTQIYATKAGILYFLKCLISNSTLQQKPVDKLYKTQSIKYSIEQLNDQQIKKKGKDLYTLCEYYIQ